MGTCTFLATRKVVGRPSRGGEGAGPDRQIPSPQQPDSALGLGRGGGHEPHEGRGGPGRRAGAGSLGHRPRPPCALEPQPCPQAASWLHGNTRHPPPTPPQRTAPVLPSSAPQAPPRRRAEGEVATALQFQSLGPGLEARACWYFCRCSEHTCGPCRPVSARVYRMVRACGAQARRRLCHQPPRPGGEGGTQPLRAPLADLGLRQGPPSLPAGVLWGPPTHTGAGGGSQVVLGGQDR